MGELAFIYGRDEVSKKENCVWKKIAPEAACVCGKAAGAVLVDILK